MATKKEKLIEQAQELGVDTDGLTVPKLVDAIDDALPTEDETKDIEVVEEEVVASKEEKRRYDLKKLVSDEGILAISNYRNRISNSTKALVDFLDKVV